MTKGDKKNCSVCKVPFERNNYYYGKLMTARDFHTEQNYFNEKRWLMNRTIHGWGIVCGLAVEPVANEPNKVKVTPGLAIDCCGREILVCEDQYVSLDPEYSACNKPGHDEDKKYIICIEFLECKTEHVNIPPVSCDQREKCDFNRIRDSFNIRVIPFFEKMTKKKPFCQRTMEEKEKSLHQYLCDRLRKGCPQSCPELSQCHEPFCVILATAFLGDNNLKLDNCSRRRLVYTNPLLYDLIYCFHGDLPHISEINWYTKHDKQIEWDYFENLATSGLSVTFNRIMNHDTINIHTFLVAVITRDDATGYRLLKYIPSEPSENNIKKEIVDLHGTQVTKATFVFEADWVNDEIAGKHSLLADGAEFEIMLRGSSIFSEKEYIFNWSEIPGNDSDRLIDFLKWKFDANWVRKDLIDKSADDKTITISDIMNISLELNDDDSKVNLMINDIKTDEFYVRIEGPSKNIYGKGKSLDGNFQGILPSGTGTQGSDLVSWFFVKPRNLTKS